MQGLISYATYIPKFRLCPNTIGWDNSSERATGNFDEDPITMGVAAGKICLNNRNTNDIDALFFATTSAPYHEKQSASIICSALDLPEDTFTIDVTGSLRSGSSAIMMALDSISAGTHQNVLVITADMRIAPAKSSMDYSFGDGATALLLGKTDVIATEVSRHSQTSSMIDSWRGYYQSMVNQWEDRFIVDQGLQATLKTSIDKCLAKSSIAPENISHFAISSLNAKNNFQLANQLKIPTHNMDSILYDTVGHTGTSMAIMELCKSLDNCADPDEIICLANYGDGSDVIFFKTTHAIQSYHKQSIKFIDYINSKLDVPTYEDYAKWKNLWEIGDSSKRPDASPTSVTALHREETKNTKLHGGRCLSCNYAQYPIQRICVNCKQSSGHSVINYSSERATLFTYSMDYLASSKDNPLVLATINFDIGGRMLCTMTDRILSEICIDMPLEMTFRIINSVNGINSYFWKTTPIRI
ncbi:MAG TPA: hypothetical protein DEZ08_00720 [Dehalococcoidia bacterium]|nr:hypothetical protein [Dehalococcoidia bacterium]